MNHTWSELDEVFHELEQVHRFSGVVLITQGAEQLYGAAYGYASRAWKIRNSLEMRFDTASITKLFTSVATLQLIEQGALAFDTGMIDFLGLEDTTISREVQIHHLLTHSSGIGDDSEEEDGEIYTELPQLCAAEHLCQGGDDGLGLPAPGPGE